MKKNAKKIVLTVGVVSLLGLCLVPLLHWVRPGNDSQDRNATQGAVIALTPPRDYGMKVRRLGSANHGVRLWQLEKNTSAYTVVAKVGLRREEPLIRLPQMPQIPNIGTLLVSSLTPTKTPTARMTSPSKAGAQRPPQIVLHRSQKATVNGITFSGFQMEEARYDCFEVLHIVSFDARGRHYDCDVIIRFADKRPDPAKVKIAAAEWRKILSSIR